MTFTRVFEYRYRYYDIKFYINTIDVSIYCGTTTIGIVASVFSQKEYVPQSGFYLRLKKESEKFAIQKEDQW